MRVYFTRFLEAWLPDPQWESFQAEKEPVLAAALTSSRSDAGSSR